MATVQYGTIVTELRGSIGGSTFQKSGSQLSLRNKPRCKTQFNNGGNLQPKSQLKNNLAYVSSFWRTLGSSEKAAYATAAPSFPFYNKFGVAYTPSAFQLFCWQNLNLINTGNDITRDAPATSTLPDFTGLAFLVDTTTNYKLSWTNTGPADWIIDIFTAQGFSPGKETFNRIMKQFAITDIKGKTSINGFALYSSIFGTPVTGQKYQVKFKAINVVTGISSPSYTITAICS